MSLQHIVGPARPGDCTHLAFWQNQICMVYTLDTAFVLPIVTFLIQNLAECFAHSRLFINAFNWIPSLLWTGFQPQGPQIRLQVQSTWSPGFGVTAFPFLKSRMRSSLLDPTSTATNNFQFSPRSWGSIPRSSGFCVLPCSWAWTIHPPSYSEVGSVPSCLFAFVRSIPWAWDNPSPMSWLLPGSCLRFLNLAWTRYRCNSSPSLQSQLSRPAGSTYFSLLGSPTLTWPLRSGGWPAWAW